MIDAPCLEAGIVCSLTTPFRGDGSPDRESLGTLIDFQIECGIQGIFVLGTAGEGILCSTSERKALSEYCLERAAGRVPMIIHCGAVDTGTAVELVRHASSAGAASVAATAPFFYAYPETALYDHFARLAEAGSTLEHYVYDNPERVGFSIGVSLVTRLVEEIDPIVGVKDTGDSLGKITQYFTLGSATPRVLTGSNVIILAALVMGARGGVSSLSNASPELFVALYDAFRGGRLDEARELQLAISRLQAVVAGLPYLAAIKHLVSMRGLPGGRSRPPLPNLTQEQARIIEERLTTEEDLQRWLAPAT